MLNHIRDGFGRAGCIVPPSVYRDENMHVVNRNITRGGGDQAIAFARLAAKSVQQQLHIVSLTNRFADVPKPLALTDGTLFGDDGD